MFNEFFKTTLHKWKVFIFIIKVCWLLLKRALYHDMSKYSKIESLAFSKAQELKKLQYGSSAYFIQLKTILGPALAHHYVHNRHHPEHHPKGIYDMTLIDKIEMICDWYAATKRHETGNLQHSCEINSNRFNISPEEMQCIINTYKELNWL